MAPSNKLSVDVTVGTDGLVTGIKVAGQTVEDVTQAMQVSLANAGAAAEKAGASFAVATQSMRSEIEGLKSSLASSVTQGDEFKAQIAALTVEVKELQNAAKKTGGEEGVGGLGDSIRKAGAKIRGEGRFAGFIARDLESLVPISSAAGSAVAGLVAGIAYGSGIAVAVSAVRLLVAAFSDTDGGVKKLEKDSAVSLAKMKEQAEDILASLNGETKGQNLQRKEVKPKEDKRDQDLQGLQDAQARLAVEEKLYDAEAAKGDASYAGLKTAQKLVDAATTQLAISQNELKVAQESAETVSSKEEDKSKTDAANEDSAAAAKINAQRLQTARETATKLDEIHAESLNGNEKLEAQYVVKVEQLEAASAERIKKIREDSKGKGGNSTDAADAAEAAERVQLEQLVTARLEAYRSELTNFAATEANKQAEVDAKTAEEKQKWLDANIKAEFAASEAIKRFHADQAAYQLKRAEDVSKEQEKLMQETFSLTKSIAGGVGSAMAGIVTGTESVGNAVVDMAKTAIKAILDIAIKTVEANAINAASGAAASQAGIPIVGPALAVGAMVAMEALVLGLLSAIPSASGGFDIPVGINPLTQLHSGEMVLPREHADTIRSMSGGGGGGDMNFHIYAWDANSFQQFLAQPTNQRAIANLVRNGNWAG